MASETDLHTGHFQLSQSANKLNPGGPQNAERENDGRCRQEGAAASFSPSSVLPWGKEKPEAEPERTGGAAGVRAGVSDRARQTNSAPCGGWRPGAQRANWNHAASLTPFRNHWNTVPSQSLRPKHSRELGLGEAAAILKSGLN